CRAAALDQFQMAVGLVGAVHVELQIVHVVQVVDRNAVLLQALGRAVGTGHGAVEETLVLGQQVDKEVGGRASADADDAAVVELRDDKVYGGLGDGLLELVLGHGWSPGREFEGVKVYRCRACRSCPLADCRWSAGCRGSRLGGLRKPRQDTHHARTVRQEDPYLARLRRGRGNSAATRSPALRASRQPDSDRKSVV